MASIGTYVIYTIMICAVIGAVASIIDNESPLGKEFNSGLHSIGHIFIPVAGIMAAIPYLSAFISSVVGPLFQAVNADPAMAATTIIAVDMGGYQLAETLSQSKEGWILASITGFMAGATIIFSIPVGLAMLDKEDHQYMAVGVMCGVLSIPIGVLVSCVAMALMDVSIRPDINASGEATYQLALNAAQVLGDIAPLVIFCILLATCLKLFPELMIKLFLGFGRLMYAAITLVLGYSDQGGKGMIQASLDTGAFDTFALGDGMYSDALLADLGSDIDGSFGSVPWAEGEGAEKFKAVAEAAGVNSESSYTRESYDAAALIALAMAKGGEPSSAAVAANILDVANAPGEPILPGELGKALEILKAGGDIDYVGATNVELIGPGEAAGTYRYYEIKDGAFETVSFK